MQKIQGFVQAGNTTLTVSGILGMITRKVQGSFPGAALTVYLHNPASAVAISAISRTSNIVTATIPTGSNFIAGEHVTIAGVTDSSFNGTFTILTSGSTTITYAQTAANASSSSGTAQSNLRLANIYSDNVGTAKANPFISPADGVWSFYANNGRYDIKFSGGDLTAPFTLSDFTLFDHSVLFIDATDVQYSGGVLGSDPTAALQSAIDSVATNSGAVIMFPPGLIDFTAAVTMTGKHVRFEGSSRDGTVLRWNSIGIDGFQIDDGCEFAHLTIRGPGSLSSGFIGIEGTADNVVIDDCIIESWGGHGINTAANSTRWTITDSIIRNNKQDGILIGAGSTKILVSNCVIYGNGAWGLDLNGSGNTAIGNQIYDNGGVSGPADGGGIAIFGSVQSAVIYDTDDNIIIGNQVALNNGDGISIGAEPTSTASGNIVQGNRFTGQVAGSGMKIGGGGGGTVANNKIIGNICDDNSVIGIFIQKVSTTTINGTDIDHNTCGGNALYGIAIDTGITNTRLINNITLGNTTAGILDNGTRTTYVGNQEATTDNYYRIKNLLLTAGPLVTVNFSTFANLDTTPDVSTGNNFAAHNLAPTSITFFDGGRQSQDILVVFDNGNTTIVNSGTMVLAGNINVTPTGGSTMSFTSSGSIWYETGRSIH